MRIIAGMFKGSILKTPKGLKTRPTPSRLRETVFNILQNKIEGATFLDLFAGSGLTSLEAISRGARSATCVDNDRQSIQCIKSNAEKLGVVDKITIFKGDVIEYLERLNKQRKQFDIIYADPPYGTDIIFQGKKVLISSLVLQLIDEYRLLAEGGIVFIEESSKCDITKELKHLTFERTKHCGNTTLNFYSKT